MDPGALAGWLRHIRMSHITLHDFADLLLSTPIRTRKALLTTARCQMSPVLHSRVRDRLDTVLQESFRVHSYTMLGERRTGSLVYTGYDLSRMIEPYISTAIFSGFISLLIRELPYHDYGDIPILVTETIRKEINAAQFPPPNASLAYESFLSPDCESYRLYYNMPISSVQKDIYRRFLILKGIDIVPQGESC